MKILRFFLGILGMLVSCAIVDAQEPETAIQVLLIEDAGYQADDVKMLRTVFKTMTGITVNTDAVRYEEYVEYLLASGTQYDVCALDHIWVADLASRDLLMPLDDFITRPMRRDLSPGLKEAFMYQKKIWGMPFLLNVQFLFYNSRMLEDAGFLLPPTSLEMLAEYMRTMKEKGVVEYPWTDAWQSAESLVTEFVWLLGAFEGQLFDADGQPAFDQDAGVQALEFMTMLLDEELAPPVILYQDELAAKDDFLAGRAAFTSNWLFLHGLLKTSPDPVIAGEGKINLLPASESASATAKTASVASVQGLAILSTADQKDAAWLWIQFFTSQLAQRAFLYEMPVWTSVQTSEDAQFLDPDMLVKRNQLLGAATRPNIVRYEQISAILQTAIHRALLGEIQPAEALSQAKVDIESLLHNENE